MVLTQAISVHSSISTLNNVDFNLFCKWFFEAAPIILFMIATPFVAFKCISCTIFESGMHSLIKSVKWSNTRKGILCSVINAHKRISSLHVSLLKLRLVFLQIPLLLAETIHVFSYGFGISSDC